MAPMTVIETITITRPLKVTFQFAAYHCVSFLLITVAFQVIAFLCGALALALLVMCLASTDWLMTQGFRQGLFLHCIEGGAEQPLPFGLKDGVGCYPVRDECKSLFDILSVSQ